MRQTAKKMCRICGIIGLGLICLMGGANSAYGATDSAPAREADFREADVVMDDSFLEKSVFLYQRDGDIVGLLMDRMQFPKDLWKLLIRNPEMISFVLDYPEKRGYVYTDTVGSVTKGEIPLLCQWDRKWGYMHFGDGSIADSGCAPTALSMVITGLTGNDKITPPVVGKFAEDNGYYVYGIGSSWNLIHDGARHFGVNCRQAGLSKEAVFDALEKGEPIICSMRKGDFTQSGHFIVLVGTEDGKIRVNDPSSEKRSRMLWTYERLEPQISNLWVCSV